MTAYGGTVGVVDEGESAAGPDEAVVDDLGDLHFEKVAKLFVGQQSLLHGELPEPSALGFHQAVDGVALLGGDVFLAQQDGAQPERLLIRAGVDDRAVVEVDGGLVRAARERERAAFFRRGEKVRTSGRRKDARLPRRDGSVIECGGL